MEILEQPFCAHCGSDDITKDATCRWNVKTQKWEISGFYDDFYCENCGDCRHVTFYPVTETAND